MMWYIEKRADLSCSRRKILKRPPDLSILGGLLYFAANFHDERVSEGRGELTETETEWAESRMHVGDKFDGADIIIPTEQIHVNTTTSHHFSRLSAKCTMRTSTGDGVD
jgi:hypothetical protein